MTFDQQQDEDAPRQLARGLWFILAPALALGLLAMAAGMIVGAMSTGNYGTGFWIAVALAIAVLAGTVWMIRRILPSYALPRSPRMRKSRLLLYIAGGLGAVFGAILVIVQGPDPDSTMAMLRGEDPIPQAAALLLAAGVGISLALSVRWHALLDEHERAAYDFGAVAAIYVYFTISTVWWLLWRAALVAPPDGIVIFFIVMAVWMVGWLIRRFR